MATDDKRLFDPTDSNPDPITHEPGAHPIGTGLGAAYTGAIGTAVGGAFGGPVGAVVGAAIGALGGGLLGKTAAESVNPTIEDEYWRTHYASRPYIEPGSHYEDYQPAYRTGYEGYNQYVGTGRRYDEVEPELQTYYENRQSGAGLTWDKARYATRDAWDRAEQTYARGDRPVKAEPVHPVHPNQPERLHHDNRVASTYPEAPETTARREPDRDRIDHRDTPRRELTDATPPVAERRPDDRRDRI